MRQIKFRAKIKGGDKFVYGYFFKTLDKRCWIKDVSGNDHLVEEKTVGEKLDFKDIEGKCIYENDIVDGCEYYWDFKKGLVKFGAFEISLEGRVSDWITCFGWYIDKISDDDDDHEQISLAEERNIKVIGNRFDNKDLAKLLKE